MIAYLEGTILAILKESLIIKTVSGVGYQLTVPNTLLQCAVGEVHSYFVHTHLRENELSLYGFSSILEKQLFESLIKISGVGPKLANAILSSFSPKQFIKILQSKDASLLSSVPGIGKKTAAKLCLELSDLLEKPLLADLILDLNSVEDPAHFTNTERSDLISALMHMGFLEKDILLVIPKILQEIEPLEKKLKKALGLLSSR